MKKAILTPSQVNENLQRLFPNKAIVCTETFEDWNATYFYIETETSKVVVINKEVWIKPTINGWFRYMEYCKNSGAMYKKTRVKNYGTCIPFMFLKGKNNPNKEHNDLLLHSCGLKQVKKEDDLTRLRSFKVPSYVEIYKLIKDVTVVNAERYDKPEFDHWKRETGNFIQSIKVTHKTGDFSFAIDNLTGYSDQDEQILNIFCNLLNLPLTSQQTMAA